MGRNKEMFKETFTNTIQYIDSVDERNFKMKRKKLVSGYNSLIEQDDWKYFDFRSVLHEIKTHRFLSKFGMVESLSDNKAGPDFLFDGAMFECTVSSFGKPGTPSFEKLSEIEYGVASNHPRIELALRVTASIESKREQYKMHLSKRYIDSETPYVLVIDLSLLSANFPFMDNEFDLLLVTLGIGEEQIFINSETGKQVGNDYKRYKTIKNKNGADVNVELFLRPEYEFISGIMFCNAPPSVNYSDNVTIMTNFNAKNTFDFTKFTNINIWNYNSKTKEYKVESKKALNNN